jgi:hypothetical protein
MNDKCPICKVGVEGHRAIREWWKQNIRFDYAQSYIEASFGECWTYGN